MSAVAPRRDLVLLVADKGIAQAITGLLQRPQALGMRRIDYEMRVHQQRAPGCRADAAAFASTFRRLAEVLRFRDCSDDAFQKLRAVLVEWFGDPSPSEPDLPGTGAANES